MEELILVHIRQRVTELGDPYRDCGRIGATEVMGLRTIVEFVIARLGGHGGVIVTPT
jgi:hypothetical protein